VNRYEAMRLRGDRQNPPDELGGKIRDAVGRLSQAVFQWFAQTGNKPSDCTLSHAVTANASTFSVTITIAKGP
jgi:hypothetical protein